MMTIPRCASQRCINILTMDDCRLEGDEKFRANLQLVNTPLTIITNSSDPLAVTIEDNDSKTHLYDTHSSLSPPFLSQGVRVQLEQTVYRVYYVLLYLYHFCPHSFCKLPYYIQFSSPNSL